MIIFKYFNITSDVQILRLLLYFKKVIISAKRSGDKRIMPCFPLSRDAIENSLDHIRFTAENGNEKQALMLTPITLKHSLKNYAVL